MTGCQSTSASRSPALSTGVSTTASIQTAADTIATTRAQVGVSTAALRNLVDRPQDIPAQYKTALAEFAKLEKGVASAGTAVDKMRAQGDAYLASWAKQVAGITDPELRNAAFSRRGEVSAKLQRLFTSYQTVKTTYAPYIAHLGDIQKVLGTDLSAAGLETVKPFVARVSENAAPLSEALSKLEADFRAAGAALQPGGA